MGLIKRLINGNTKIPPVNYLFFALKSISLDVRAGEVQVLLGENGAGKSTLMKILAGEHAPTGGEIMVGGRRVSALATELGIGLVHQELSLIPALSVTENIFLGRMPRNAFGKINWGKAHEAARHALEALGVSVEPTSALSDSERSRLFDVIRRLKQRGHGIIYISHHLSEIPMIADRVTVLRDGVVVETLPAEKADEETVIGLMVGRLLEEQFPKEAVEPGAPMLAIENLASGRTLKDLSFTLRRGEILGIYGLMGAGQAELASALFGLQPAKAGSIAVEGKRADFRHSSDAIAVGLGLISRDRRQSLVPMQPIGPNLSLSWLSGRSRLSRLDLRREREEGQRYIADLRIRPASTTHKLFFFSGGNQQKVILAGGIDLSGAAIAALAASITAVLLTQPLVLFGVDFGFVPPPVAILVGLAVGVLAGALNGWLISKFKIPDFIATLGTMTAFRGAALLVTDGLPVPSFNAGRQLPESLLWVGGGQLFGVPVSAIIALLCAVAGWYVLRYTALGRAIYSVGGNRAAARSSGISISRTKIMTYAISGLLAAIAGIILIGRLNSANALMAEGEELRSIASVVIGVLGNGLNLLDVSPFWQRIAQGIVIVAVVIFDQWRRRSMTRV